MPLHIVKLDKREVRNNSPNVKREAVVRSLDHLKEKIRINEITTD